MLAPFATKANESRGRLVAEPPSPTRLPFQRDRDRIIHSHAFRRLRNKTQVFIESEGDYFRTRLTHSLEVAQIARAIARLLKVDEDLAEALALAHDLGHTCFGHAGEKALDEVMKPYGGFDHNDQTFRILTKLERRYASFNGLNLTWETLEGVVKHNGPLLPEREAKPVPPTIKAFQDEWDLALGSFAGIEAQIAAFSDDIAYNTHDFDDGFNAGLFSMDELAALPVFDEQVKLARQKFPKIEEDRLIHEIVRQAIGVMIEDLLQETKKRIDEVKPQSAADVRGCGRPLVGFSATLDGNLSRLRGFLMERMYRHPHVNRMTGRAAKIVQALFRQIFAAPELLPENWYIDLQIKGDLANKNKLARAVADYIAGMTDRFAEAEYERLFPETRKTA